MRKTGAYIRVGTENIDIVDMTDEQLEDFVTKLSRDDEHIRMCGWITFLAKFIRDNVIFEDGGA